MTEYCLYLWFILFVENDGKLVLFKTKHKPAPTQLCALLWEHNGGCPKVKHSWLLPPSTKSHTSLHSIEGNQTRRVSACLPLTNMSRN